MSFLLLPCAEAWFRAAAGSDDFDFDFVVAYGDESFPLSVPGMDGGGSAHKRLMTLLSKKYDLPPSPLSLSPSFPVQPA